jgi:hypothetical protein
MAVFAELRSQIGIAPACVALSINRAGIYRTRDRLARRHCAMLPRRPRPRPALALSEAERALLILLTQQRAVRRSGASGGICHPARRRPV